MLYKSFRFFCVAVVLCAGCAHKAATYQKATGLSEGESGQASPAYYAPVERLRMSGAGGGGGAVLAAPRFVAVRHKLEILEPGSGLAKSIEAVVAFCGTIQCEVLSSSVTNETAVLSPSGNITARVAPQDLNISWISLGNKEKLRSTPRNRKTRPRRSWTSKPNSKTRLSFATVCAGC